MAPNSLITAAATCSTKVLPSPAANNYCWVMPCEPLLVSSLGKNSCKMRRKKKIARYGENAAELATLQTQVIALASYPTWTTVHTCVQQIKVSYVLNVLLHGHCEGWWETVDRPDVAPGPYFAEVWSHVCLFAFNHMNSLSVRLNPFYRLWSEICRRSAWNPFGSCSGYAEQKKKGWRRLKTKQLLTSVLLCQYQRNENPLFFERVIFWTATMCN